MIAWALRSLFQQKEGIDLCDRRRWRMQRLRGAAELAKCELSLLANTEIRLPFIAERRGKPVDLALTLEPRGLEPAVRRSRRSGRSTCRSRSWQSKGLVAQDISEVILVGGMTRMPAGAGGHSGARSEKPPRKGVHPDEVVALRRSVASATRCIKSTA